MGVREKNAKYLRGSSAIDVFVVIAFSKIGIAVRSLHPPKLL